METLNFNLRAMNGEIVVVTDEASPKWAKEVLWVHDRNLYEKAKRELSEFFEVRFREAEGVHIRN